VFHFETFALQLTLQDTKYYKDNDFNKHISRGRDEVRWELPNVVLTDPSRTRRTSACKLSFIRDSFVYSS
jgi:hypothetical protein